MLSSHYPGTYIEAWTSLAPLSDGAFRVYCLLRAVAERDATSRFDSSEIAAMAQKSPRSLPKITKELREAGLIEPEEPGSHTYRFLGVAPERESQSVPLAPTSERGPATEGSAVVYVITHATHQALKIGISLSRQSETRLRQHTRRGWRIHRIREFPTLAEAATAEERALTKLRSTTQTHSFLGPDQMPQGGFSETFPLAKVSADYAWKEVNK